MKIIKIGLGVLAAGVLISTSFAAMMVYNLQLPNSTLEFNVNSTLHEIEGKVTAFSVKPFSFDFDKPLLRDPLEVTFRVHAMVTGMKARDAAMYKTFEADHYPNIVYKAAAVQCSSETAERLNCTVPGDLTIRDKTLPVLLHTVIERHGSTLHARGITKLSLKAFDLHPPSVMGFIKVFDEVTVSFDTGWAPAPFTDPSAKDSHKVL